jgi:hypothetical protein
MRHLTLLYSTATTQKVTVDENSVLLSVSAGSTDFAVSPDQSFNCDGLLAGSYPTQVLEVPVLFLLNGQHFDFGIEFAPGTVLYCTTNSGIPFGTLQLIFDKPPAE